MNVQNLTTKITYADTGAQVPSFAFPFKIEDPTELVVTTVRRDRKSTRLNSSHRSLSRMPSSA